jgi:molybdopterin-guanine dinucleotide biosynthesis protein A
MDKKSAAEVGKPKASGASRVYHATETAQVSVKPAAKSPVKSSTPAGPTRSVLPVHDSSDRGGTKILRDELAAVVSKNIERLPATAIVLAGGLSSRMGCDKAMLEVNGEPLIARILQQLDERFAEVLVSARDKGDYRFLNHRVVPDRLPGLGPLMAIVSALESSRNDLNFVVSCDVPELTFALIERLLQEATRGDGAVPVTEESRYEPLFAVYRKSILPAANEALLRGDRRVIDMFSGRVIRKVYLPNGTNIKNLNTVADYNAYCDSIRV